MNDNLLNILKYLKKIELTENRLLYILYLIDWKSAIEERKQLTNLTWIYKQGPDIEDKEVIFNIYSDIDQNNCFLTSSEKMIITTTIKIHLTRNYSELTRFVISTYPIIGSNKGEVLNLVDLAKEYSLIRDKY